MDKNKKNKTEEEIEDAEVVNEVEEPVMEDTETLEEGSPADEIMPESEAKIEYATPNAEEAKSDSNEEESASQPARYATPNAASALLNLESLINGYIVDMEKIQEKMKTQRDMFNDAFLNDAEYSQIMQKVKEVNRIKAAAKQRIMKLPNVVEVANKMKEYKEEMKDIQEGLSSYLKQYQELSGLNQITSDNGEVREIVSVVKLVKRTAGK